MTHKELIEKYRETSDIKYRNILITENIGLIYHIIRKHSHNIKYDELLSAGCCGMITAINKYNPDNKVDFISFAYGWIRNFILKEIHNISNVVKIPNRNWYLMRKIKQYHDKGISDYKIAELTEITTAKVRYYINYGCYSINERINNSENTFEQFLGQEDEYNDTKECIDKLLHTLPIRSRKIIQMRYGIDYKEHTLREIADTLKLSPEGVRHIINNELKNLRKINI